MTPSRPRGPTPLHGSTHPGCPRRTVRARRATATKSAERRDNESVSANSGGPSPHRTQVVVAAIGVAGLVIAGIIAGVFALLSDNGGSDNTRSVATRPSVTVSGGNSTNKNTCVGGGTYVEGDVNCTQSST